MLFAVHKAEFGIFLCVLPQHVLKWDLRYCSESRLLRSLICHKITNGKNNTVLFYENFLCFNYQVLLFLDILPAYYDLNNLR